MKCLNPAWINTHFPNEWNRHPSPDRLIPSTHWPPEPPVTLQPRRDWSAPSLGLIGGLPGFVLRWGRGRMPGCSQTLGTCRLPLSSKPPLLQTAACGGFISGAPPGCSSLCGERPRTLKLEHEGFLSCTWTHLCMRGSRSGLSCCAPRP